MHESLVKHVLPACRLKEDFETITILDICFGLGFNTLATLYHLQKQNTKKIYIYSPELDSTLIESLHNFSYPKEFEVYKEIIEVLIQEGVYEDKYVHIELFRGDAREYILRFEDNTFDIVYQDAFSPSTNPLLWTQEYFRDIARIIKKDGILTTYSLSLPTRLALHENGFLVYINSGENYRDATLASKSTIEGFKEVDMKHKIACNPDVKSFRDE